MLCGKLQSWIHFEKSIVIGSHIVHVLPDKALEGRATEKEKQRQHFGTLRENDCLNLRIYMK
jgi:hypothetical protein